MITPAPIDEDTEPREGRKRDGVTGESGEAGEDEV